MRRAIAGVVCTAALIVGVSAYRLASPFPSSIGRPPGDLPAQPVEFAGADSATLHGWFVPSESHKGAVILMHGVHANRLQMLGRARFLHRAGYSTLLFDSRAHGESTGAAITFGYLESKDANAALQLVHNLSPGQPVGVVGVSLGGAAAVLAEPRLNVDALVMESVYPTIQQAIEDRLRIYLGPLGVPFTPLLSAMIRPRLGFAPDQLRPIDRVRALPIPKLIAFGTRDRNTTPDESRQLFEAAAAPKQMWSVEGAAHVDLYQFAGAEYERQLLSFFERYLAKPTRSLVAPRD